MRENTFSSTHLIRRDRDRLPALEAVRRSEAHSYNFAALTAPLLIHMGRHQTPERDGKPVSRSYFSVQIPIFIVQLVSSCNRRPTGSGDAIHLQILANHEDITGPHIFSSLHEPPEYIEKEDSELRIGMRKNNMLPCHKAGHEPSGFFRLSSSLRRH